MAPLWFYGLVLLGIAAIIVSGLVPARDKTSRKSNRE